MKIKTVITIAPLLLLLLINCIYAKNSEYKSNISLYLPGSADLKNWELQGSPQKARGEDLFVLINGGAEIYLRYGFEQAVFATYKSTSGKRIHLEIFEMKAPAGASEVYARKKGDEKKETGLGDDALLADYYLIFRKDQFYVVLTGDDSEKETRDGLTEVAKYVEKRIELHRK
ncbi:hypothetical protein QUF80_00630 [Desulfococcaceae bacterium HSG8]|nr:hypothetical protein [Desulfococcaceae bacterium HSG8]